MSGADANMETMYGDEDAALKPAFEGVTTTILTQALKDRRLDATAREKIIEVRRVSAPRISSIASTSCTTKTFPGQAKRSITWVCNRTAYEEKIARMFICRMPRGGAWRSLTRLPK